MSLGACLSNPTCTAIIAVLWTAVSFVSPWFACLLACLLDTRGMGPKPLVHELFVRPRYFSSVLAPCYPVHSEAQHNVVNKQPGLDSTGFQVARPSGSVGTFQPWCDVTLSLPPPPPALPSPGGCTSMSLFLLPESGWEASSARLMRRLVVGTSLPYLRLKKEGLG